MWWAAVLPIEQFWSRVEQVDGCWLRSRPDTYGTFKGRPAYRWAYEEIIGLIPPGLELDHLCNNRACVNPWHLEPVSHTENMQRCSRRGRMRTIYEHPDQVRPRYGLTPAYRLAVEFWAERIRDGRVRPGTELTMPGPELIRFTVQRRGWEAAQKWLVAYGLAEIVDGRCFARKAT